MTYWYTTPAGVTKCAHQPDAAELPVLGWSPISAPPMDDGTYSYSNGSWKLKDAAEIQAEQDQAVTDRLNADPMYQVLIEWVADLQGMTPEAARAQLVAKGRGRV